MYKLFFILATSHFASGSFLDNYIRDRDVRLDDLIDDNYDAEAKLETQESVDETLKDIIRTRTKAAGYALENHRVVTDDGYILTVHRIPYAPANAGVEDRPVVFLQHGVLSCSYHWLTLGPGQALAYILAEAGYDVWMGNARGNSYSKKHLWLSTRKAAYWNFSWNEIGYYDLPAMIDYILKNTNQAALNYVGHSQGTTAFFVMTSSRPEYNRKIKALHALAPVAFMSHIDNPFFRILGPLVGELGIVRRLIGGFELLPSNKLISTMGSTICHDGSILQGICTNIMFLIFGFSNENVNATLLPEIMKTSPAGASVNQFIHYAQGIRSGKFRKFDYGFVKNLVKYNSISPPNYNLGKITAPVHLYYSRNDWLAAVKDVQILASKLPNVVYNKQVPHDTFNHLDFLWGVYVKELVYNDLLTNIKKYT